MLAPAGEIGAHARQVRWKGGTATTTLAARNGPGATPTRRTLASDLDHLIGLQRDEPGRRLRLPHRHHASVQTATSILQWRAGIRRRIAPHQLRHCHAIELVREGVPVHILQRQLGHANLAVTAVYLAGVAPEEVLAVAQHRRAPSRPTVKQSSQS